MGPLLEYIAERRAFRKQDRDMTHAAHPGCAEKEQHQGVLELPAWKLSYLNHCHL